MWSDSEFEDDDYFDDEETADSVDFSASSKENDSEASSLMSGGQSEVRVKNRTLLC